MSQQPQSDEVHRKCESLDTQCANDGDKGDHSNDGHNKKQAKGKNPCGFGLKVCDDTDKRISACQAVHFQKLAIRTEVPKEIMRDKIKLLHAHLPAQNNALLDDDEDEDKSYVPSANESGTVLPVTPPTAKKNVGAPDPSKDKRLHWMLEVPFGKSGNTFMLGSRKKERVSIVLKQKARSGNYWTGVFFGKVQAFDRGKAYIVMYNDELFKEEIVEKPFDLDGVNFSIEDIISMEPPITTVYNEECSRLVREMMLVYPPDYLRKLPGISQFIPISGSAKDQQSCELQTLLHARMHHPVLVTSNELLPRAMKIPEVNDLNESQRASLEASVAPLQLDLDANPDYKKILADTFKVIEGPPGTGKSKLIATLAKVYNRACAHADHAVYILAATNAAVIAIARKLNDAGVYDFAILESLREATLHPAHYADFDEDNRVTVLERNDETKLCGINVCTISVFCALKDKHLVARSPAVVILDEASKAYNIDVAVILRKLNGKGDDNQKPTVLPKLVRMIIIGDSKQLPPFMASEHNSIKSALQATIAFAGSDTYMLRESYRMPLKITESISKHVYNSCLTAAPPVQVRGAEDCVRVVACPEQQVYDECHHSKANFVQTQAVVKLYTWLHKRGWKHKQISVICMYQHQVTRICEGLCARPEFKDVDDLGNVGTVDGAQGHEADIVILVMSSDTAGGRQSFLQNRNRLNVAITRTKQALFVITSMKLIEALGSTNLLRNVLQDCSQNDINRIVIQDTDLPENDVDSIPAWAESMPQIHGDPDTRAAAGIDGRL